MPLLFSDRVKINSTLFNNKVRDIASDLGMNPDWLMAVMNFETAGTFSPSIKNPYSSAVGLIQFLSSTAEALGTTTGDLLLMTNVQQLDYVKKYYKNVISEHGTIDNVAEAYLAVFYPAAINYPMDKALPAGIVRSNPVFDLNTDGIITKQEIIDKIQSTIPVQYRNSIGEKKTL